MKEIVITSLEAGQRMDRLLGKYLREAPKSFLYKMMRKKNITLNGKKAEGSEKLREGDVIRLFFSQETLKSFQAPGGNTGGRQTVPVPEAGRTLRGRACAVYKQAGGNAYPESQAGGSFAGGISDRIPAPQPGGNRQRPGALPPSVCNRLDRNTSGIVAAGKTVAGLQELGKLFHDRTMDKYYRCVVKGELKEACRLEGYLAKDGEANQVRIFREEREGARPICTEYVPLGHGGGLTLLEVKLITGRSHQIRAHLSSIGHPILGILSTAMKN